MSLLSDMPFVFHWNISIKQKRPEKNLKSLSWATRIRTWKMLESESSALPFGDSPLYDGLCLTSWYYIICFRKMQAFFEKIRKKISTNMHNDAVLLRIG